MASITFDPFNILKHMDFDMFAFMYTSKPLFDYYIATRSVVKSCNNFEESRKLFNSLTHTSVIEALFDSKESMLTFFDSEEQPYIKNKKYDLFKILLLQKYIQNGGTLPKLTELNFKNIYSPLSYMHAYHRIFCPHEKNLYGCRINPDSECYRLHTLAIQKLYCPYETRDVFCDEPTIMTDEMYWDGIHSADDASMEIRRNSAQDSNQSAQNP